MEAELFPKLTSDEMAVLADYGPMTTIFPGTLLYREGMTGRFIYAVLAGELHLTRHSGGQEKLIAALVSGDFSGDVGLQLGAPSSFTLKSAVRSVVAQIRTSEIHRLISDHSDLGYKLIRTFARRSLSESFEGANVSGPQTPLNPQDKLLHAVSGDDHTIESGGDGLEIVVYGDYQCPFTWKFQEILDSLMSDPSEGKIRFTFRHFPQPLMHPQAELAARAAEAAHAQGKFWRFHSRLLRLHGKLMREELLSLAKEEGLDLRRFGEDLDSDRIWSRIARDLRLGEENGIEITPAVFLEGHRYTAPIEKASLSNALLRQLQKKSAAA